MNAHSSDILGLIETLGSNADRGLNEHQVQEKTRKYGENKLQEKGRLSVTRLIHSNCMESSGDLCHKQR